MSEEKEDSGKSDVLDIGTVVKRVVSHWYLFVLVVPLFLALAVYKGKQALPSYDSEAQLLIRDSDNKMKGAENLIEGLQMFSSFANIENEIGIIKSTKVISRTLDRLDFDVSYYSKGKFRQDEHYQAFPIRVELNRDFDQLVGSSFTVKLLDDGQFSVKCKKLSYKTYNFETHQASETIDEPVDFEGTFYFGEEVRSEHFAFTLYAQPEYFEEYPGKQLLFKINNRKDMVVKYKSKTQVKVLNKTASIIVIGITEENREKALNFVNTLCDTYVTFGLEEKNRMASNTINFIDEQLGIIGDSLQTTEKELQRFRSDSRVMDLSFTSNKALGSLESDQRKLAEKQASHEYYKYLLNYVTQTTVLDSLLAPSLMGINDPGLTQLLTEINNLRKEEAAMLYNSGASNPGLQRLNNKVQRAQATLIENVNGLISSSEIQMSELQRRIGNTLGVVGNLPKNERDLINIERKFQLNDQMFKYLQEKRAEAAIALAANIPDNKVLDYAQVTGGGEPNPMVGYVMFSILGMILPIVFVVVKGMVQKKILGETQFVRVCDVPVLGNIAPNHSKDNLPIVSGPRSQIAETIRTVRTNLQYKVEGTGAQVFGISSFIMGEGKSFMAGNLAASLAMAGHQTVVIGGDLRKPQLFNYIGKSNNLGLTTYLTDKASLDDVLLETSIDRLRIIPSGPTAMFPAEILGSDRMEKMIETLRSYFDYIIIDTPPVRVVADFYVVSRFTDVNLFVVRNNFTKSKYIKELNDLYHKKRLKNMYAIFNDFAETSVSFRKTHQSYYELNKRVPIWQRLFRKVRLWT